MGLSDDSNYNLLNIKINTFSEESNILSYFHNINSSHSTNITDSTTHPLTDDQYRQLCQVSHSQDI